MKKPRHHRKKKKGIVGIEAAIVLIAFVIVAAALAFVVLNMGMFTTQKSKEVISRGLEESTSALQVAGTITAEVNSANPVVDAIAIPIQVSPGREAVDLSTNVTTLYLQTPSNTYTNTHLGVWSLVYKDGFYYLVYIEGVWSNSTLYSTLEKNLYGHPNIWSTNVTTVTLDNTVYTAMNLTVSTPPSLKLIIGTLRNVTLCMLYDTANVNSYTLKSSVSFIVFTQWTGGSTILKFGEKALVVTLLAPSDELSYYQQFTLEIRPPVGAPLTISRSVPASLTPGTLITLS